MSQIERAFAQAQEDVKTLNKRPDNADMLFMYSHFKQATAGDASGPQPGMTDFKERFKFDSWSALKGMPQEEAMRQYTDKINALLQTHRVETVANQVDVPLRFVRAQLPIMAAMCAVGVRSAIPLTRPKALPKKPVKMQKKLAPAEAALVDSYAAWSGAPAGRYVHTLPPHFCSHWAMAMLSWLGGHAPYNVLSLLNQGLRLQIHQPLPRGKELQLEGELVGVQDDGSRARIHSRVVARVAGLGKCMTVDSYSVVVLGRSKDKGAEPRQEPDFETVGRWSVEADDGVKFALLTGDFNPIHTVQAVGRRSRFGSCILHGFGQLARTYEPIVNAGYNIAEIDIRWIKPVPLPSQDLEVQVARSSGSDGRHAIRLRGQDGAVHIVGSILTR